MGRVSQTPAHHTDSPTAGSRETPAVTPNHTVVVTPGLLIRALEEVVTLRGSSHRSVALSYTETDGRVEIPMSPGLNGIVGQALVRLGVSPQTLSLLGDFLVEGDANISPTGPFHLTQGSRELAILADDLDALGWEWGSLVDLLIHGDSKGNIGALDCE